MERLVIGVIHRVSVYQPHKACRVLLDGCYTVRTKYSNYLEQCELTIDDHINFYKVHVQITHNVTLA